MLGTINETCEPWRIPKFLVRISTGGTRHQGLLIDTGIPALVEGDDAQLLIGVFLDDPKRVFVCVE